MKSTFIAIPAILANIAVAAPVDKRNVVWTAVTVEDYTTLPTTTTIWVDGPTGAPKASAYSYSSSAATTEAPSTTATSTYAPPPSTTSTSSAYVPPPPVYTPSTSSSSYVAPVQTYSSSAAPAPAPSYSAAPAPAPAPSAAPASSGSASAANFPASAGITLYSPPNTFPAITSGIAAAGSTYTGPATYYAVGLGACGWTNTQNDNTVALQEEMFDQYTPSSGLHAGNTNMNTVCGKSITISHNGKSYPAVITDRCPGCGANGLDFSQSLFEAIIGNTGIGTESITWSFD